MCSFRAPLPYCGQCAAAWDLMDVEVVVPQGTQPGDDIIVETGPCGTSHIVTVPEGVVAGERIIVTLSPSLTPGEHIGADHETMYVTLPDGIEAGAELLVDAPDGRHLTVSVPSGVAAGESFAVSFPSYSTENRPAWSDMVPTDAAENSEGAATLAGADLDDERSAPSERSSACSSDEDENGPKFFVGSPVEVLRSDGLWTLCTVVDYDRSGGVYTVELRDGRRKYFVEPDDLRIPRFLLLTTANI